MRVAILGANGRSGKACVEACLEAGMAVHAGVFSPNTLAPHPKLTVTHVDGQNKREVMDLVKDCDAVVSLIGHVKGSPASMQTEAIKNVLAAMDKHGVKRLISLTGTGVRLYDDTPSLIDKLLNISINMVDPARIEDGKQHANVIQASDKNWTIVRVLKLTNGPVKKYHLDPHGPARLFTSRKTVARAIVAILQSDKYIRSAPIITR